MTEQPPPENLDENLVPRASLSPVHAVRLLRAKAAELEASVGNRSKTWLEQRVEGLAADIALVAQLLADQIERSDWGGYEDIDDANVRAMREERDARDPR